MFLYLLMFLFGIDKFSFYQLRGFMNVSRFVAMSINTISIGDEKVKVIIDSDPVGIF